MTNQNFNQAELNDAIATCMFDHMGETVNFLKAEAAYIEQGLSKGNVNFQEMVADLWNRGKIKFDGWAETTTITRV